MDVIVKPTPTLNGEIGALSSKTTLPAICSQQHWQKVQVQFIIRPTAKTVMRCADVSVILEPY